jgi:hypothetical protein
MNGPVVDRNDHKIPYKRNYHGTNRLLVLVYSSSSDKKTSYHESNMPFFFLRLVFVTHMPD